MSVIFAKVYYTALYFSVSLVFRQQLKIIAARRFSLWTGKCTIILNLQMNILNLLLTWWTGLKSGFGNKKPLVLCV